MMNNNENKQQYYQYIRQLSEVARIFAAPFFIITYSKFKYLPNEPKS